MRSGALGLVLVPMVGVLGMTMAVVLIVTMSVVLDGAMTAVRSVPVIVLLVHGVGPHLLLHRLPPLR